MSGAKGGSSKPPSKNEAEKILNRDDFSCRFCGFRAVQYQRLAPTAEGFVTACGFCEQVTALERTGLAGGGVLIWLPEISQTDLHHITRAIYIARADDEDPLAAVAARALDALMARRTEAKKRLGSDDPLVLATVLLENLDDKEYKKAIPKLDGIRLMPLDKHMVRGKKGDINNFPQMIKFWRSAQGPFGQTPTSAWQDLFAKLT